MESFPSFDKDGSSFWSAAPLTSSMKTAHYDLLAFLSVAQKCNVDMLHISWQPSLQSLGGGIQTEISQSLLDLRTGFAFKRTNGQASPEAKFRTLISEVSVLQNPSIRSHPNIINLEGVCWEIEHDSYNVWPVLVFQKAPLGDLRNFMASQTGQDLPLTKRMHLCVGIGQAIRTLHSYNIVHGDLKPENILIFPDDSGQHVPKVADFGFSCLGSKETDIVLLPKTLHWEAPEWHHRGFQISAAKKTDMYSFGLLCLWVLFNEQFVGNSRMVTEWPEAKAILLLSKLPLDGDEGSKLKELKEKDILLELTEKLININETTSVQQKAQLTKFFNATLRCDSSARELRLDILKGFSNLDSIDEKPIIITEDALAVPNTNNFSVATSIHQICHAEYRVRSEIVRSLENRAARGDCQVCGSDCSSNAAFQLAYCYRIGFGIARDEEKSRIWLEKSKRDYLQLISEIEKVKNSPVILLQEGKFKQLWLQGRVRTLEFTQSYRERNTIKQVKLHLNKEIQDMESTFGEENYISLHLREVLASILRHEGAWSEAEHVEEHILKTRTRTLGLNDEHTQRSMSKMASTYRELGKLDEAEGMGRQVLDYRSRILGHDHIDTLTSMADLATTWFKNGKFAEAEKMYGQVLCTELRLLGEKHTDTIITMINLAATMRQQGKFQDAEKLNATAAKMSAESFGPEHTSTLSALSNLAYTYQSQGRWDEAGKIVEQVSVARRRILGPEHPSTLEIMSNMGLNLEHQGKLEEAQKLLDEVLDVQSRLIGRRHSSTLNTISSLASILTKRGLLNEALLLEEECMTTSIFVLGEIHPDTLACMANLAYTYRELNRLDEAEKLQVSVIQSAERVLGRDHPSTLTFKSNLAAIYTEQNRLPEAKEYSREAMESKIRVLGPDHKSTITSMLQLSDVCDKLGHAEEADEIRKIAASSIKKGGVEMIRALGLG